MPVDDNKLADFIAGLINAIMTGGEKAAEAYITALDPAILSLPIIQFAINTIVEQIGKSVSDGMAKMATGVVIDIQTHGENSSVVSAATALQYAIAGKDPNAIATARQKVIETAGSLIHWDGTLTLP